MPSVCSNASCKTWTPLHDRFTDEHMVENVPTLRSGVTSAATAGQRYESCCDAHAPAASPQKIEIWLAGKFCDEFFAPYHFSCLSTLIKTRSSAENTMFIVYTNCLQVTSDCSNNAVLETEIFCHRYLNINNSAVK